MHWAVQPWRNTSPIVLAKGELSTCSRVCLYFSNYNFTRFKKPQTCTTLITDRVLHRTNGVGQTNITLKLFSNTVVQVRVWTLKHWKELSTKLRAAWPPPPVLVLVVFAYTIYTYVQYFSGTCSKGKKRNHRDRVTSLSLSLFYILHEDLLVQYYFYVNTHVHKEQGKSCNILSM